MEKLNCPLRLIPVPLAKMDENSNVIALDWALLAKRFNKLSGSDYSFEGSSCTDEGFLELTIDLVVSSKEKNIYRERYTNSGGNRFYLKLTDEKMLESTYTCSSHPLPYNNKSITISKFHLIDIVPDFIYPALKNNEFYKNYFL